MGTPKWLVGLVVLGLGVSIAAKGWWRANAGTDNREYWWLLLTLAGWCVFVYGLNMFLRWSAYGGQ